MKYWFLNLSLRERQMVVAAVVVTLLYLLFLLVWQPISDSYERNKKNVLTASETIRWMNKAAKEVKQLGGSNLVDSQTRGKGFILGVIDRSVRKAGLANVMKRVQPEGSTGVRIWFENATFDEFFKWLTAVEDKQGLIVNEINIEKTESTGLVNIRLYLES